ncbi:homoserine O-acetyltransferase [Corynebacterium sp. zg254]|uniref:Homoserine O-acetyltransferase n=1 Tax=Corynebacterium zhongnanshanii TaxID=2768834 RepID=A0ABQ6VF41_9CORY|nr:MULTISPECIES: homoserine O-acetyltransferase [Corynebacterium]KAB3522923.1 homoserine O-acetyltransferase [Corynebacterium zhongnanshanii]MCR5914000.1 homoserine O-acetyltransferase [Corynebacterium sp. zg254]
MHYDLLPATGGYTDIAIGDLVTEAGVTIPEVSLRLHAFYTATEGDADYAEFSAGPLPGTDLRQRPIILVEHALTGNGNVVDWWEDMVGEGKPIDTNRYLVLCANVLGGCDGSTGPSSPHPDGKAWGSRFPGLSIRDMVTAEKKMLEVLGITQVHAIIGASMGGARTLEWTLMYPDTVLAALPIAVSARASAWQIGIQSTQIRFIEADPHWQGGDYYGTGLTPSEGMGQARRIAHLTYRGELEIDERFGTDPQVGENPLGPYRSPDQRFAVESYLDLHAERLKKRFDPGTYAVLTDALNRHDVGRGRNGMNAALGSSQVPTMVVGVDTDILYPLHQQEHLSRNLGDFIGLSKITSPTGHDGFLIESRQMGQILVKFLGKVEQLSAKPVE